METALRKMMGCTCLRMRRATRRVTQLYDHALEPGGLTINQFGLLAYLHGATLARANARSIGTIAGWLGMDPTTLNRNLKPLIAKGLVTSTPDPADGRVRVVRTTDKGKRALLKAIPLWQEAQAQVENALGREATTALNDLLDLSSARLRSAGHPPEATRRKARS
jgi:DNA-binding MarR family transcriptional regulator